MVRNRSTLPNTGPGDSRTCNSGCRAALHPNVLTGEICLVGGSARKEQGAHSGALAVLTPLRCPVCADELSFPTGAADTAARRGPVGGQGTAPSTVRGQAHRGEAPSCRCPVPPGGRRRASDSHMPGPPAQAGNGAGNAVGNGAGNAAGNGAALRLRPLGNEELWRRRERKAAPECPLRSGRSAKCRAEQGAAAAGLARRWSRAAMRGGIGESQASHWDFAKVVGNAGVNGGRGSPPRSPPRFQAVGQGGCGVPGQGRPLVPLTVS